MNERTLMSVVRCRYYYSGRVQGVGFRATCRWIARGFTLAGYVRNLPDGRVELLVEGESAEIDRFLSSVQTELGAFITGVSQEPEPVGDPRLVGFNVRY
jgi:acylphosphatase